MASSSSSYPVHSTKASHGPQDLSEDIKYNENSRHQNFDTFGLCRLPCSLDTPLHEFKSLHNGEVPAKFPRTVREFRALDLETLDELAEALDQKVVNERTRKYPIKSKTLFGQDEDHKMKLFLFGSFIGLDGPVLNPPPSHFKEPSRHQIPSQKAPIPAQWRSDVYNPSLDPAPKKERPRWNWLCGGRHNEE
ncbi:hypothetical protein N7452_007675 [Penicillium brevicompactum]|uniref:Uncharacterized protein n=1 Tax=Penicillium brevicompactum TaxID=5074 RepID=A0A9W9QFY6_PENBR|nr:hypothetical protein N7452_007675 [Penicillium brevicompactum]